eukprot:14865250-Alexandrium_andersonii.AAC.1
MPETMPRAQSRKKPVAWGAICSAAEVEAAACWAGACVGCCIHCGGAAAAWSMLWHGIAAGDQRGGAVGAG